jgi:hypothetical protein
VADVADVIKNAKAIPESRISCFQTGELTMSNKIPIEQELRAAIADADPMNKAWVLEVLRIRQKQTELEVWEEVLLDLTLKLESTMKKITKGRESDRYDQFLLEQLRLLVLPNPENPQADREKALAMVGIRPDGKPIPRPTVAHMSLGEPLDTSTRNLFRKHLNRMSREARDPASDSDRWLMRIMVVLLTSALEGCDVNVLADATGYPRSFIEHVWWRAKQTGVELNPLNWVSDDGLALALWQDAGVIEGKTKLERYSDGTIGLFDVANLDDFVPEGFVAAFRKGPGAARLARASNRGKCRKNND